ncbi:LacI family DNA-binding transcriptional regulator [Alkalicoccus daliensis]|uniref:LacI family transcriptional regulator n=1 Tax=Alkalicoccus daliensis TaxID=745820 RepID=A0A1H0EUW7_9BACI|nr:LacI family DNA-binding transcriptional regulator [Alkalicoccus daliensis]SDN86184.1 LacI family transcriptional regulator [Alkalicoccus daliensis]
MATIRDIAAKAGYSIATVSRVLNHDYTLSVSDKARKTIFEIAEELDYKTKQQRNTKKMPAQLTVGMICFTTETEESNHTYFLSIRQGIEKACAARGIQLKKIYRQNEKIDFSQIEGLPALIVTGELSAEEIDLLSRYEGYITFVDHAPLDGLHDAVIIDAHSAVRNVLKHLKEHSHKKIAYIGSNLYEEGNISITGEREEIFREYFTSEENSIYIGADTAEKGYELMKAAMQEGAPPSAVFAASDTMAAGVLRALHDQGLRIPEDVSVIGFHDLPVSRFLYPSLTTVKTYPEYMGESAVEMLEERLESNRKLPRKMVIPTELIRRESSGALIGK